MVYELLRRNVVSRPDAPFLVTERRTYSYRQVHNLAGYLRTQYLHAGSPAGTVCLNIGAPEVLCGWIWACLMARRDFALLPAIADPGAVSTYLQLAGGTLLVSDLEAFGGWAIPAAPVPEAPEYPSDPAGEPGPGEGTVSFLSSGTSGAAKLIRVAYAQITDALACIAREDRMPYTRGQCVVITPSLSHSYGFSAMLEYTQGGSTIILPADRSFVGLVRSLMHKALRDRITAVEGVAYFYQQLRPLLPRLALPNLRHVGFGGDFAEHAFVAESRQKYPGLTYSVRYGLSEIPSAISVKVHPPPYPADWESVGRVLGLYQVQIVDDAGTPLPDGEEGEVVVHYAHPAGGTPETRRIATGDTGLLRHGELVIKGRKQFFLKCKGYKIYPAFVEGGVKASGLVEDVRATARHNKLKIEIIPGSGYRDKNQLLDFLVRHLPDYAVPDIIEETDEIPRNAAGKIIRAVETSHPDRAQNHLFSNG
ncbi:MAG: hypothetical protein AVDCRST_MAG56-3089 [uncultured Cytophagales bacterium]|uniref:AMP-dependent synthetase/ligase domain-containing protein n=1 Tax=uncultured Cytophagales bacterium TaxID=158755 RepID=A0A6J4J6B5_9SPHI|nr:MAG: hypothetical protein AVDCRST_MAG56-3089 [uncultured Cytophagales bacterium]